MDSNERTPREGNDWRPCRYHVTHSKRVPGAYDVELYPTTYCGTYYKLEEATAERDRLHERDIWTEPESDDDDGPFRTARVGGWQFMVRVRHFDADGVSSGDLYARTSNGDEWDLVAISKERPHGYAAEVIDDCTTLAFAHVRDVPLA